MIFLVQTTERVIRTYTVEADSAEDAKTSLANGRYSRVFDNDCWIESIDSAKEQEETG